MRVLGISQDNNWTSLYFDTTYAMSWNDCQMYVISLLQYMNNASILTAQIANTKFQPTNAKTTKDILNLQEQGALIIRGNNKIYDNAPFQFIFYNQTHRISIDIMKSYTDTLKKSETEYMTKEDLLHTFDRFMDSIELSWQRLSETSICFNMISSSFHYLQDKDCKKDDKLLIRRHESEINLTEIIDHIQNDSIIDRLVNNTSLYNEVFTIPKFLDKYENEEIFVWCGYDTECEEWIIKDYQKINDKNTVKVYATYDLAMKDVYSVLLKEPMCVKKISIHELFLNNNILYNLILVSTKKEITIFCPTLYEKGSIYNPLRENELPQNLIK